jgi:hypothetical protein
VLTSNAAKLTAKGLARLMLASLRRMRDGGPPKHGKQTVKQLARQGGGLQNIEITDYNIRSFERVARKYNVDFALKRDSSWPPKWLVFFKARDADTLAAAFQEFSQKALRYEKRPSVREAMAHFRDVAREAPHDRIRHKVRGEPDR